MAVYRLAFYPYGAQEDEGREYLEDIQDIEATTVDAAKEKFIAGNRLARAIADGWGKIVDVAEMGEGWQQAGGNREGTLVRMRR